MILKENDLLDVFIEQQSEMEMLLGDPLKWVSYELKKIIRQESWESLEDLDKALDIIIASCSQHSQLQC